MKNRGPWNVLRRRWATVVVGTLVGLSLGAAYTWTATVTYRAEASVFFSLTAGNSAADLVQGSTYAQNQVESFARLATTPAVLQPVVDDLRLDETVGELAGQIDAAVPVGTVIVAVGVTDESPRRSAQLANAVVASLTTVVEKIAPKDDDGKPTVLGTTVAPAETPTSAASPDVPLGLAAGLLGGLVAGFGLAWLRELLDTRIRDAEVLAEVTDRPLIGSVGAWSRSSGQVIVARAPHSPQAESFRQLRTNLQFLRVADEESGGRPAGAAVVAVTSSLAAEGKSTTASNLAVALAETGARVLLVDADLRRPSIATALGIEGSVGLTTVLSGQAEVADVVQEWGTNGLDVLASGPVPPNPAELLGSPAMYRLVQHLRRTYDYVVVDTAPLLPVTDAAVLSRVVDGTILVADAGRVRRGQVAQALANLEQVSGRVLGVVLNRIQRDETSYEYRYDGAAATQGSAVPAPREPRVRDTGLHRQHLPVAGGRTPAARRARERPWHRDGQRGRRRARRGTRRGAHGAAPAGERRRSGGLRRSAARSRYGPLGRAGADDDDRAAGDRGLPGPGRGAPHLHPARVRAARRARRHPGGGRGRQRPPGGPGPDRHPSARAPRPGAGHPGHRGPVPPVGRRLRAGAGATPA